MELIRLEQETGLTVADLATWDDIIDSFLDTLSESTRRTYEPTLRKVAQDLGGVGPGAITPARWATWARSVREDVEADLIAPNTGKRQVMAVKSFLRFAHTLGQSQMGKDLRAFALKAPKGQVLKPFQVLSEQEQLALLGAVDGQDRQIIATLLYAGLRVSELCRLKASDAYQDEESNWWLKVRGKGGKSRNVPIGLSLGAVLEIPDDDGPMFVSRQVKGNGSRNLTRVRVYQIVKVAVEGAGIAKRISPHSLRHTAAMNWLRDGVPLPVVQKWLGHTSLAVTQRYLNHLEDSELHSLVR